eukprot:3980299-Lingulodinium_polyedra.AAC.1
MRARSTRRPPGPSSPRAGADSSPARGGGSPWPVAASSVRGAAPPCSARPWKLARPAPSRPQGATPRDSTR